MAKIANRRWSNLTGGERLPANKKRQEKALKKQEQRINAMHGPVTVRKATEEELSNFK